MEYTALAACSAAAVAAHYSVPPLSALAPSVADGIFERLTRLNLAQCSLVCRAWRYLPCTYLYSLTLGDFAAALPPTLLPRCCNLREVHVTSSSTSRWLPTAAVLAQQQLPSLCSLSIQHSSNISAQQLQQLQRILQVRCGWIEHCSVIAKQACWHAAALDPCGLTPPSGHISRSCTAVTASSSLCTLSHL
ncbi:hypothetical protein COO60DRAFT_382996 [Scenedesmus sp. NREL 46B-D3]|nr:hypothetical protein COO60DRAFT_382996 [Scenedesmus sp. NREL 46B-D3]